jgi:tetratricopeptide (TPR) repeat protein
MVRKLLASAALVASAWPFAAQAIWQEASSAHFIVYADDKPERIKAFTERLERFDKAMRVMRGVPDEKLADADRVRVYMVGNIGDIRRLAGKGLGDVAGFYETRVGGPVAFVPRDAPSGSVFDLSAQAILLHEYTHHFMFLNWPNTVFPEWFVEGFAEFTATATFNKDGGMTIGQPPIYRASSLGDSSALPASRMLQLDPGKLGEDQTQALYGRGWLLLHYLTFDQSRAGQLAKYLDAINSGKKVEEATEAFGNLKKLDSDMTAYIMKSRITVATLKASSLPIGEIKLRILSPGEAAVMPARLRSTRGVDTSSAADVALLASKLAAPYPSDAGAQNELAEAEFDAGHLPAAKAAVERALAADPKSIHALIYKSMVMCAELAKAEDRDPSHWRAARHGYVEANHLDPDNPLPLTRYYRSFFQAHEKPTSNAEDGLLSAYTHAPYSYELRMNAAIILLRRGEKERARLALLPVAYSPHRAGSDNMALDAVTAIDAGKIDAALKALESNKGDKSEATQS